MKDTGRSKLPMKARLGFPTGWGDPYAELTVTDNASGMDVVSLRFTPEEFMNLMSRTTANGEAEVPSPGVRHRIGRKTHSHTVELSYKEIAHDATDAVALSLAMERVPAEFSPEIQDVSVAVRRRNHGGRTVIFWRYGDVQPQKVCGVERTATAPESPLTCGRYVDPETGKHDGWHAGFDPETGQTATWSTGF
jgi:hypothetical protein